MNQFNDPKITINEAIEFSGNNQAELGRLLGLTRTTIHLWVKEKREYLPPLHAYRFRDIRDLRTEEVA